MENNAWLYQVSTKRLINRCKYKFGWKDLSDDVIMDLGCGVGGYGGRMILETFPELGGIIGINKVPEEVHKLGLETKTKIQYVVADIENRESLRDYEGRMSKLVSFHVLHQITGKKEAFQNIYHLLKPGGEAAVLFAIKNSIYEWLSKMLKKPRWKDAYRGCYVENLYKSEVSASECKNMVIKIGFLDVQCFKEERELSHPSDQICKEALYQNFGKFFNIPPELLEEFKEESFQELLNVSARDAEGKPCIRLTEVSLLLTKPDEDSVSKTEDNMDS